MSTAASSRSPVDTRQARSVHQTPSDSLLAFGYSLELLFLWHNPYFQSRISDSSRADYLTRTFQSNNQIRTVNYICNAWHIHGFHIATFLFLTLFVFLRCIAIEHRQRTDEQMSQRGQYTTFAMVVGNFTSQNNGAMLLNQSDDAMQQQILASVEICNT